MEGVVLTQPDGPRRSARTLTLHNQRLAPQYEVSAAGMRVVVERLEQEGFKVHRRHSESETMTVVVEWGPLSFQFVEPKTRGQRPLMFFDALYVDNLSVEVTYPDLAEEEVDALTPLGRWIYQNWEHYLVMHLQRLMITLGALRLRQD
jgi:hypothetical protein